MQKNCHEGRLLRNNKTKSIFFPLYYLRYCHQFSKRILLFILSKITSLRYFSIKSKIIYPPFFAKFSTFDFACSFFALLLRFRPSKSAGLQPNLFCSGTILGLLRRGTLCGPLCVFALKSHQNRVNLVTSNQNKKLKMRKSRRETVFHWDHEPYLLTPIPTPYPYPPHPPFTQNNVGFRSKYGTKSSSQISENNADSTVVFFSNYLLKLL